MAGYKRYTEQQIDHANNIDLVSYIERQGYEIKRQGRDYKVSGQDGLLIKADRKIWWHELTGKGGGPIQFVMAIQQKTWADSVSELLRLDALDIQRPFLPEEKQELILPEKAADYRRLFAYLCHTRGINSGIVADFVRKGKIYQDTRGNCVFVTRVGDTPVYASLRSTVTNSEFRGDVAGSCKIGWGRGDKANDAICVFESPIDLMSYMTVKKQLYSDLIDKMNYISVGGVNVSPLLRCLDINPAIRHVIICTDNDQSGERFFEKNRPILEERGLAVSRDRPCRKDWNEDLISASDQAEEW